MTDMCPRCGTGKLFFSGDGRTRECEHCGHRISLTPPPGSSQRLQEDTTLLPILGESGYRYAQAASLRLSLAQGIAAAKEGDTQEAYFYLTRVLRHDWDEDDRLNAWLWLSQVVTQAAEKRYCLEQVLALAPAHGLARRALAVLDGRLQPDDIIDPDQLEREMGAEPVEAEAEQFTCPRCAGPMQYTPDGRVLLCEFCHYQQELDADGRIRQEGRFGRGEFEQEFMVALATAKGHTQPEQMRFFLCHSCAVEFVLAPETISITCPYCGAVYVTETAESREIIPPHALIPFQINADEARNGLRRWFKQHAIARPRLYPIVGIYLPVWTFDIGAEIKWTIRGSTKESVVSFFNSFPSRGVNTRLGWPPRIQSPKPEIITGTHLSYYDDVLVPAGKKLPAALTKRFAGFDLGTLVAYDSRYLADWPAERYQIPLADASLVARKKVMKDIRKKAHLFTHGRILHDLRLNSSGLVVESFKHILLPMWVAHYQVSGSVYDVTVNGQNGRVHGDRPQGAVSKFFARLLG